VKLCISLLVQFDDRFITLTDDQERRRFDLRENWRGQIGSPTARYNGSDGVAQLSSRKECSGGASARSEIARTQVLRFGLLADPGDLLLKPPGRIYQSRRKQANIEAEMACIDIHGLLFARQQIEEQCADARLTNDARDELVARTEAAAAAAMREEHDASRALRQFERPLERHLARRDVNFSRPECNLFRFRFTHNPSF
jgi:hypothetical protein